MDDGRGFLDAIREHPDDDLHRLAWADWLDDHGDDARAAFVRAQVHAARLDPDDPRRDALEDEADDLLADHESEWAGRVGLFALEWGWSRGCVESVTAWADDLLEHGDEMFAAAPVRRLRLLGDAEQVARLADWPPLDGVEVLELAHTKESSAFATPFLRDEPIVKLLSSRYLGRLAELDLRGQGVEGPAVEAILHGGLIGRLRRLELAGNRAVGDRLARLIAATPSRLSRLSLADTNVTSHGLRAMLASAKQPELRELSANLGKLFRNEVGPREMEAELLAAPLFGRLTSLEFERVLIDPEAMRVMLSSPSAANLRSLTFTGCWNGEEVAEVVASASSLVRLRRLAVAENVLRDRGVSALAASPYLANLTELDVSQNAIGGPGLKAILGVTSLPRLERLNLASNFLGPSGAEILARGDRPRRLTSLRLSSSNLSAAAAEALAGSPALSRLRELWLNGNRLGDEGVKALAESPHLGRLRCLHLDSNDVDSPGAKALIDSPYLRRVQQLSMRNAFITPNEREQLRALFGPATQF